MWRIDAQRILQERLRHEQHRLIAHLQEELLRRKICIERRRRHAPRPHMLVIHHTPLDLTTRDHSTQTPIFFDDDESSEQTPSVYTCCGSPPFYQGSEGSTSDEETETVVEDRPPSMMCTVCPTAECVFGDCRRGEAGQYAQGRTGLGQNGTEGKWEVGGEDRTDTRSKSPVHNEYNDISPLHAPPKPPSSETLSHIPQTPPPASPSASDPGPPYARWTCTLHNSRNCLTEGKKPFDLRGGGQKPSTFPLEDEDELNRYLLEHGDEEPQQCAPLLRQSAEYRTFVDTQEWKGNWECTTHGVYMCRAESCKAEFRRYGNVANLRGGASKTVHWADHPSPSLSPIYPQPTHSRTYLLPAGTRCAMPLSAPLRPWFHVGYKAPLGGWTREWDRWVPLRALDGEEKRALVGDAYARTTGWTEEEVWAENEREGLGEEREWRG